MAAEIGRSLGEMVGGGVLMAIGTGGSIAGGALSVTGLGAAVGVPALAVSASLVAGGAGNVAAGIQGLTQALMSTGSGSSGPPGTTGAASGTPLRTAEIRGFASEAQLEHHFAKHASEWGSGNITKMGYAKRAESLLRAPIGGDVQGFTSKQGWLFRYNSRTNEFATMKPDGTIETIVRPRNGASYWAEQIRRYAP